MEHFMTFDWEKIIFNYLNSLCVTFATIAASWVAVRTYKKQRKYNLTDIIITIIDDDKREDVLWYVKFRFTNCQKTINKIVLNIQQPFILHKFWSDGLSLSFSNHSNSIELSNVFNEDYVMLCLVSPKNISDSLREQVNIERNTNSILQINSKSIRLQPDSFNISQLYYA